MFTAKLRLRARLLQNTKAFCSYAAFGVLILSLATVNIQPFLIEYFFSVGNYYAAIVKAVLAALPAFAGVILYLLLSVGTKRYFFCAAQNRKKLSDLFYYFKPERFAKALRFGICLKAAQLCFFIVCFFPIFLMLVFAFYMLSGRQSLDVTVVFALCLILMLVCCAYFYFRFKRLTFLCEYIFVSGRQESFLKSLKMSAKQMSKQTKRLFFTRFSFAGWFALCAAVFPIAYVWGYYEQTMALFAGDLLDRC